MKINQETDNFRKRGVIRSSLLSINFSVTYLYSLTRSLWLNFIAKIMYYILPIRFLKTNMHSIKIIQINRQISIDIYSYIVASIVACGSFILAWQYFCLVRKIYLRRYGNLDSINHSNLMVNLLPGHCSMSHKRILQLSLSSIWQHDPRALHAVLFYICKDDYFSTKISQFLDEVHRGT